MQRIIGFELNGLEGANDALLIKCTLDNSGVYTCYPVIHLPLWWWAGYEMNQEKLKLVFFKKRMVAATRFNFRLYSIIIFLVLIVVTSVALIVKTQGRTAYIALLLL